MTSEETVKPSAYEAVYTDEHLVTFGEKAWLRIELGGRAFALPMVNVTPDDEVSSAIAWFDPKPEKNPELSDAAAVAMAGLLQRLKADVVVMPKSSKSEAFIRKAAEQLNLQLVTLLGGAREPRSEDALKFEAAPETITYYTPVTRTSKMMGLSDKDVRRLRNAQALGMVVVKADDVKSTGETFEAIDKTTELIFGTGHHLTTAVIAVEALLSPSYPPPLSTGVHALIAIPEIIGKLNGAKLFSIAQRESIPQAKVL
jgi:hypothetical protein